MEGMERLCSALSVDPSDLQVLVLAWKLQATQMCQFTREEWHALAPYQVEDISGLKQLLPRLVDEAMETEAAFKSL